MRIQSFLIAGFLGLILLKYTPLQGAVLNSKIHPSAHIHSSVIMEGDIEVGANTVVGAHSYLKGPLVIGSDNQIGPHVMIGVDPEHKTKKGLGCVRIGNGNTIREFSVIQRGTGDLETQIDNDCYIMAYTYIAHDSLIESDVILCARVSLSGRALPCFKRSRFRTCLFCAPIYNDRSSCICWNGKHCSQRCSSLLYSHRQSSSFCPV